MVTRHKRGWHRKLTQALVLFSHSVVLTFCTPMGCSLPGTTIHRISQTRTLEWVDISFSWESSWSKAWIHISCLAARLFITEPQRSPYFMFSSLQFSRSVVSDSATPWNASRQASLSITNSRSSLRLTSIESVMPSSHLILCHPLLLLPPIPPNIRVFSNESSLPMRWPKYWSSSFASFLPKNT